MINAIGPDYWNINKHWRLCSSGRKQSPVDIRTDRLVYDHLLAPIRLVWMRPQARAPPAPGPAADGAGEQPSAHDNNLANDSLAAPTAPVDEQVSRQTNKVARLIKWPTSGGEILIISDRAGKRN